MTRMPMIGDSVQRRKDGKVTFDGYIARVDHASCRVAKAKASEQDIDAAVHEHALHRRVTIADVSTVSLVRGLYGWRWAPFDGRPDIGDVLVRVVADREGVVHRFTFLLTALNRSRHGGWYGTIAADRRPDDMAPVPEERASCEDVVPLAIAGRDGWSWEPARWSAP